MDLKIFTLINNLASKNPILDQIGIFLASGALFLIVLVAGIVLAERGKRAVISPILALILVLLIDRILNLLLPSPRPFLENNVNLLIGTPHNPSFPSTHAAISATAAMFLFNSSKILGVVALIFAILVGISRIFVGVHYPSDVLGGWILGIAAYIISVKLMLRLTQHQP